MKFGILWELLPFLGHYYYWKYLLSNLWLKSKKIWLDYEKAFQNLPNESKFKVLSCLDGFNERFQEYILNPQVLLSYAIDVVLINRDSLSDFVDFLKLWESMNLVPIFHRIKLPFHKSINEEKVFEIYNMLKSMGANQEKALTKDWLIKEYTVPTTLNYKLSWRAEEFQATINSIGSKTNKIISRK